MNYLFPNREKSFKNISCKKILNDEVDIIDNAIVLPELNHNYQSGGIVSNDGKFVEESCYEGDWIKRGGYYSFDTNNINDEYEDIDAIYLGFFIHHWGHYLMDCLGRAWILLKEEIGKKKIIYLSDSKIDGNYFELLRLLGVKDNQVLFIDRPTRFKSVIIPSIGKDKYNNISQGFCDLLLEIRNRAIAKEKSVPPDYVYLSRTKFNDAKNKEIGELYIQQQFEKNGFKVLYPEQLSVLQQITIFNRSKKVACVNGTIPLNCIFALYSNTEIIVINKTSLKHNNLLVAQSLSHTKITYIDCYYEPIKNHPKHLGEGPFWIEFNKNIMKYFSDNNMKYDVNCRSRTFGNYMWYYRKYLIEETITSLRHMKRKIFD